MAYKPLAGFCVATAVFICAANGAPTPPAAVPPSGTWSGAVVVNGSTTPAALHPGDTITVSGDGYAPDANVTFALYSEPTVLAEVVADGTGTATASATIPTDTPLGNHTVMSYGDDTAHAAHVLGTNVSVTSATAVSVVGTLPYTGIRAGFLLAAGIVLLISGFALVRVAALRGRRGSRSAPAAG